MEAGVDGRTRRSERSRQAMVEAMFDLVGEGTLRPTAHQVAERAGVGIRTVFRHFSDMDTLLASIDARLRTEMDPMLHAEPPEGTLEKRARSLVRSRTALFERIANYKRSANLLRRRSDFLRRNHAALVREQRVALSRWLPELERAPVELSDALEVATSFETWDRLRTDQRLGARRAASAIERMVLALLAGLPSEANPRSPKAR